MEFFNTLFFQQTKKSITFDFWSSTTSAETKFLLPKISDHWKKKHYCGLADNGKGYLDSDINRLYLGNLQQYTTVPSQCEKLPWTWTWRLLYFDYWSNFEKLPVSVYYVTCKQLTLQQGACYGWQSRDPYNTRNIILYYFSTFKIATVRYQFYFYFYLRYCSEKWTKCTIVYWTTLIFLIFQIFQIKISFIIFSRKFRICDFFVFSVTIFWGSHIIS